MIGSAHIIVGATVGVTIGNPWIAFPTAFASHYLFDMIPHHEYIPNGGMNHSGVFRDFKTFTKASVDAMVGFTTVAALTGFSWRAIAGGAFGVLPDVLTGVGFLLTHGGTVSPRSLIGRAFASQRRFHKRIHFFKRPYGEPLSRALLVQAVPVAFLLWAAVHLRMHG